MLSCFSSHRDVLPVRVGLTHTAMIMLAEIPGKPDGALYAGDLVLSIPYSGMTRIQKKVGLQWEQNGLTDG